MILKNGFSRWDALKFESQKMMLAHELTAHGGCIACTARSLGINRTYIFKLMRDLGLPHGQVGRQCRRNARALA